MPKSNTWKVFVNEFNILIGKVQSLKQLYQTRKLYLNLNSFADTSQQNFWQGGLIKIYLKKLPSLLL